MPLQDELGARMKEFYEEIPKTKLMRRTPVAIRVDGKSFHTFTRGMQRPFDEILIKTMQQTMQYLCENVQGTVMGYCQSDEITLLLIDYKKFSSAAFFDYEVQKMCSIAASMATMAFNKAFKKNTDIYSESKAVTGYLGQYYGDYENASEQLDIYRKAFDKGAMFDARCFNIPKEEVANLIYWRQLDATRNSIQMVGQANFSHNELQNKSCNDVQNMLLTQKNINWNDLPTYQKRGSCCVKKEIENKSIGYNGEVRAIEYRTEWVIDTEIPIFKGEGREYIDKLIHVGED